MGDTLSCASASSTADGEEPPADVRQGRGPLSLPTTRLTRADLPPPPPPPPPSSPARQQRPSQQQRHLQGKESPFLRDLAPSVLAKVERLHPGLSSVQEEETEVEEEEEAGLEGPAEVARRWLQHETPSQSNDAIIELMTSAPLPPTSAVKATDAPERSQASPWKFWRKLSTRRTSEKKGSKGKYHATSGGHRTEWTHPSHLDLDLGLQPASHDTDFVPETSGSLPDVVDKAVMGRSNSLKAPPKPPRLFLFRSSSINHPRSSLDGGSSRNSVVDAGGGENEGGVGGGEIAGGVGSDAANVAVVDTEPIYVNSAFGAALKTELSCNDRIIPPTVNNNNNYHEGKDGGQTAQAYPPEAAGQMELPQPQPGVHTVGLRTLPRAPKTAQSTTTTTTAVAVVGPNYHTLPTRRPQRNKGGSSDTSSSTKKVNTSARSRRRSSEKQQEVSRHKHIMHSALDLLCQRLDPFNLLDDLQTVGVLSPGDVQAFRGHPDRKLICESLAKTVGEGDYTQFTTFIQVVRAKGGHEDVVRVLDAMRALDRIVHHLPCLPSSSQHDDEDTTNQILADEKMISYDVGYLAPDGLSLKPLVELERVRPADRNRLSRLSAFTGDTFLSSVGDSERGAGETVKNSECIGGSSGNPIPCGGAPVMITACITGHSLNGPRAVALADVVRQHDCILELRIGKTQLGSANLVSLCSAMAHNTTLASLDIRLNTLDFVSACAVANMLLKTQALRQLNLSSTGLDVAGCRTILAAVAGNKTLTHLDMSFLDVGDAVCESVRDTLKSSCCLQRLRLRSNNFSAAGCLAIAEGLNRNRSLLELDLSRNCIGDVGAAALARYVPESCLQEISMENCSVTAASCDALALMITGSRRLRSLDLSVNYLGDGGVLRLGAALERSSVLQTVGLNMCGVTNDGFAALLDVLEKNASITLLKLCYNRLGREHTNPAATSDNLRYRLRIVTSSKPKLKILLWGNSFDEA